MSKVPIPANLTPEVRKAWSRLNPKQRILVTELSKGESQMQACKKAGYSAKSIKANASRYATHPDVVTVQAHMKLQALNTQMVSVERLISELTHVALSNPQRLVQVDPEHPERGARFPGLDMLEESLARSISSFEVDAKGKLKITFWDKLNSIEKLLKLHNAYPEKKLEGPRETIVGVVVLPAKQPYQGRQNTAIEGEAKRIERTDPLPPPKKKFIVPRVDQ